MDELLTEYDARDVLKELAEAQNEAHLLGLEWKIPPHQIEAIEKEHRKPIDILLNIILKFLRQADPPPTWRVIVDALRSPTVNLTGLASKVEASHFPAGERVAILTIRYNNYEEQMMGIRMITLKFFLRIRGCLLSFTMENCRSGQFH